MNKLCEICSRECSPQEEEACLKSPRLNLGAGHMILKDHINYDQMIYEGGKFKADIVCSLDELAEAGLGGLFHGVLCSHVIEHFYPNDADAFIQLIRNLLAVKGRLVLEAPDIFKLSSLYAKGKYSAKEAVANFYGDVGFSLKYEASWMHHWGYTGESAANLLKRNGFAIISVGDGITYNHADRDFRVVAEKVE